MRRFDLAKLLFYGVIISTALLAAFGFGLYSGAKQTVVYHTVKGLTDYIEQSVTTVTAEAPKIAKLHPSGLVQPAYFEGSGVTLNDGANPDELVLLSGFFPDGNGLRLIRRDGTVVASWTASFFDTFPASPHLSAPPRSEWNVDLHGALALPDGSVVFNFEYSGLVKLDRCGEVVWKVPLQTHHSVERAEEHGFWVPGRRQRKLEQPQLRPFEAPYSEDTILRISDDGLPLAEISVPELFYKNGLDYLLTANGGTHLRGMNWDRELLHLNKVTELSSELADDFPLFETGDLILSLRNYNLLMVVDPKTWVVKWWHTGPWVRQHDPEFRPGGTIVVFNNNEYHTNFGRNAEADLSPNGFPRGSNIIQFDPATSEHSIVYGQLDDQELYTVIRGKHDLTDSGSLLITESEGGRVFEIDPLGRVIWQYINRYDEDEVGEINEARVYPKDYFSVTDWTCDRSSE